MWRARNIQQRRMMNRKLLLLLSVVSLLSTGCTRMPEEYRVKNTMNAAPASDTRMLKAIANAAVGSTIAYTDQITGLTSEINIQSEYFSANGRICRRYTEGQFF